MDFNQLLKDLNIDEKEVLERFSNNQELLQRFIFKFADDKTFEKLKTAFLQEDYAQQEIQAHTLKGITANLGFSKLYELCVDMLQDLRGEKLDLNNEFNSIKNEYELIINILAKFAYN